MPPSKCPHCNANLDGGSILETFKKQRDLGYKVWEGMSDAQLQKAVEECYAPPYRWDRRIGIEHKMDDRTHHYECPDCRKKLARGT